MGLFAPGTPRLKLISSGLTLYLPPPDKGQGVTLEWVEKAFNADLIDGSESCRRLGWIPQVTLKYGAYNDVLRTCGLTIGGANGNLADINSLLALLDTAPGLLRFSPGPAAGGFVVNRVTVGAMGIAGAQGIATGLSITLRGGVIYSAKILGAF